jgi:hypothetical protein
METGGDAFEHMLNVYEQLDLNALSPDERIALGPQIIRDSEDVIIALKAHRIENNLANRIIRAIKMQVRSQEQWQKEASWLSGRRRRRLICR